MVMLTALMRRTRAPSVATPFVGTLSAGTVDDKPVPDALPSFYVHSWNGTRDRKSPERLAWHLSTWTANTEAVLAYLSQCASSRHGSDPVQSDCLDVLELLLPSDNSGSSGIPRVLHRIWECEEIPEQYEAAVWSWLAHAPEYAVFFWTGESRTRFIRLVLGARYEHLYTQLLPGAYRADLFRYVVLFYIGGYYSDMDTYDPVFESTLPNGGGKGSVCACVLIVCTVVTVSSRDSM